MTRQALRLKHNDNTLLYLAAFLIPAALMLILFIRLNVTPFGNRGVGIKNNNDGTRHIRCKMAVFIIGISLPAMRGRRPTQYTERHGNTP